MSVVVIALLNSLFLHFLTRSQTLSASSASLPFEFLSKL
jgi:hypothetical protein